MTIGYLAQVYPSLTMTFVYREVLAFRNAGFDVQTFATWPPDLNELSEEAKGLVEETFYIFPLSWGAFLLDHCRYLLTRPRRYLGTLFFCLTRKHKTFKNRLRTFFHFCQAVKLASEVERRKIQHLHAHFALNATTIAMVVSRLLGTTFSFTAHANDIFVNPILLPQKIQEALFIVVISEYNKQFLQNIVSTEETRKKIHLVHCGIDVQHFSPPDIQPDVDKPIIFSVGRLIEKKGFLYLIKACRILADQGYQFKCLIAGGGPQETLLKQMVEECELGDYVELMGVIFQEDLKAYLGKPGVFVLPCVIAQDQDMDGIPNSLMEAMAMEMPAISTTVSGIPELIVNEKTGLLVPPRDEVALAKAIATLLENQELRITLGKSGRQKVIEEFEIKENVNNLLNIFEMYLKS